MMPIQQTESGALRSIPLSDGQPIRGDVVAVIDEAAPKAGAGVYYIVTAVRVPDVGVARRAVAEVIAGRSRRWHYHDEGIDVLNRMADTIAECGLFGEALWMPRGLKGQKVVRPRLMAAHMPRLEADGIEHLIIESGDDATNGRDQAVLSASFEDCDEPPFACDWRSKNEPLTWIADTFCGAVAEHLLGIDSAIYGRLSEAGLVEVENL